MLPAKKKYSKLIFSFILAATIMLSGLLALASTPKSAYAAVYGYNNINVGDYIDGFGKLKWRIIDKDSNGLLIRADRVVEKRYFDQSRPGRTYYSDGVTYAMFERISPIGSGIWDYFEIRQRSGTQDYTMGRGTNLWRDSDMRAYLNERGTGGFASRFTSAEWSVINSTYQKTLVWRGDAVSSYTMSEPNILGIMDNTVHVNNFANSSMGGTQAHRSTSFTNYTEVLGNYDSAYFRYDTDKVFLLDLKQNGAASALKYPNGVKYSLTLNDSNEIRGSWLRTPYPYDGIILWGDRDFSGEASGNVFLTGDSISQEYSMTMASWMPASGYYATPALYLTQSATFKAVRNSNGTDEAKGFKVYGNWGYSVTFDADGGTPVPPAQTISDGDKVAAVANPTKNGYVFLGWYHGDKKWDFAKDTVSDVMTLKAKWEAGWTVTFDADGGKPAPPKQTVKKGDKVVKPPDPTKESYGLAGWYNGDKKWDFNNAVTSDITLKAKWQSYTVTFDADGGYPAPQAQQVGEGGKVKPVTNPQKTGPLSFGGWYNGDKKWDFSKDTVTKDITLKARWGYKVDFDVNFTAVNPPAVSQQVVVPNEKATKPTDPVREGYVLTGWYREVGFDKTETDWDFSKNTVTEDITLKARWEEGFLVTFNANGGTPATTKKTVKKNEKVAKIPNPTKEGYAITGWYHAGLKWDFEKDIVKDNMTLTAGWEEGWTVTFDADGGTPAPAKVTVLKGAKAEAPAKNPAKDGFIFAGWYQGEYKWNFDSYSVTQNITLKAKWEAGWTIIFDTVGGSPILPKQTVKNNEKVTAVKAPVKEGFAFAGWYSGYSKWDFDKDTVTRDITLTAQWEEGRTVIFDTDGGKPIPPNQTVKKGEKFASVPNPSKEGYSFEGWYYQGEKWDFNTYTANENITLTARWQTGVYKVKFSAAGGEPIPAEQKVSGDPFSLSPAPNNGRAAAPAIPQKAGYMFIGWYETIDEQEWLWDFFTVVTKDMTLKAKYKKLVLVTFEADNGTIPVVYRFIENSLITPPKTPQKAGYLFQGWYNGERAWDFAYDRVDKKDITLTAKWIEMPEDSKYKVTFDTNGGYAAVSQHSAMEDGKLSLIPDPAMDGYAFTGWYYGDKKWNFENDSLTGAAPAFAAGYMVPIYTAVAESAVKEITLTARWERLAGGWNTVAFNTDGGDNAPLEQIISQNGNIMLVIPPEKEGHTFLGWYNSDKLWNFESDKLAADITLIAKWQKTDTAAPSQNSDNLDKSNNGWWITLICLSIILWLGGGFAIYWVVFKKKSLANLFKKKRDER